MIRPLMLMILSLTSITTQASILSGTRMHLELKAVTYTGTVNQTCAAAMLEGLQTKGFQMVADQDWCTVDDSALPELVKNIAAHIQVLHEQTALALGFKSAAEIFGGSRLALVLRSDPSGPFGSTEAEVTAFSDFTLDQFSDSVYVHELGHTLTDQKPSVQKTTISDYYSGLDSYLISEGIADVVSSFTTGVPGQEIKDVPATSCLRWVRSEQPGQSFVQTLGYYEGIDQLKYFQGCCTGIAADPAATSHEKSACDRILQALTMGMPDSTPEEAKTVEPLTCYFERSAGPYFYATPNRCDEHLFAVPLTSFFNALARDLSVKPLPLFVQAMSLTTEKKTEFVCSTVSDSSTKKVSERGLTPVFNAFRGLLSAKDKIAYDRDAQAHGLDLFLKMDRARMVMDAQNETVEGLLTESKACSGDCHVKCSVPAAAPVAKHPMVHASHAMKVTKK